MQVCLEHAEACLKLQSPRDYVRQVAAVSLSLQRCRQAERVGGVEGPSAKQVVDDLLKGLRETLEPEEVPGG